MLGWGIVLLTVIDGVMLSFDPQYEPSHASDKNNNDKQSPDGPVFSILIKGLSATETFIGVHEKLLIVISTIAIAAFTGTLYRATSGLLRAAAQQQSDMRESLRIAGISAAATERSVELAREEFISTHRPKLIVRCVFPLEIIPDPIGNPIRMYYVVANIGDTPALIVESVHGVDRTSPSIHSLRIPVPTEGKNMIGAIAIAAGAEHPVNFTSEMHTWDAQTLAAPENELNEEHGIFCTGHIIYRDANGIRRHTVFRRRYYSRFDFFRPVSNPEQEYAD
jgi:hypothetical protein